ncbi:MAG TPA: molybdopterin-synthase adenylyltransferase MoeB [Deltaproteobacteria bacterium]|nr:molybdopterin-synthase adenylyltransferase MoeB [Candidatus Binatota bacterium]HIL13774.1 molybdopterin-synthase adenylyltransferase MoeB [Deltaproteobacteria bacterium]
MASTYDEILADARREIPEVTADEAEKLLAAADGHVAVDVREKEEFREGHVPGALSLPRGFLEMQVETKVADHDTPLVVYCQSGVRSMLAARQLKTMGYSSVCSMAGGYGAWKGAGHEWEKDFAFTPEQLERYSRHFLLPEVGEEGQAKLLKARVLCLGAGGLGSPAAYYLAAAGVGTIGIVDDDVVDMSNLQRQILHANDRVGMAKTESAAITLNGLNPDINVVQHRMRLDSSNIMDILKDYDLVVDGCDNFPTRYLVNDACVMTGTPNVHGSIFQFEGQATVFHPGEGPCYRCLFPEPPPPGMAPSCQEAGVLGVLPGLVGCIQALEAMKLILGAGKPLIGRLAHIETLGMEIRLMKLRRDPACPMCGDNPSISELIDYEEFCSLAGGGEADSSADAA